MSKVIDSKGINAEVKNAGEEIKGTAKPADTTVEVKQDSKAIGQVPLPGSGAGKGSVVKK